MVVYIAGRISGIAKYEAKFEERAKILKASGYEIVSPIVVAEHLAMVLGREPSYAEIMRADLKELLRCDGISLLDNWKSSKGARLEKKVAEICGLAFVECYKLEA